MWPFIADLIPANIYIYNVTSPACGTYPLKVSRACQISKYLLPVIKGDVIFFQSDVVFDKLRHLMTMIIESSSELGPIVC